MAIIFFIVLALLVIIGAIYLSSSDTSASETTRLLTHSTTPSRARVILKNTSDVVKKQTQKILKIVIKTKPPMLIMKCPSCYREFKVPSTMERFHCPYCNRTIEFEEPNPKYL